MLIGVVADDITGSNDIGIMFAKSGCETYVCTQDAETGAFPAFAQLPADVMILNTNSRLDTAEEAYRKVFAATQALKAAGCERFHNKTCSVFRGNIGAEFDAMLDALALEFAVVVLGFPKNGRITLDGIHYVHGKPLAESEFRNDPIHPMTCSNLVEILQSQTRRKVAMLDHRVVARGSAALREEINRMRPQCNYLIFDVADQDALRLIAGAVYDEPVLCGSSAIGEELPPFWNAVRDVERRLPMRAQPELGNLILAGSLMPQTAAQIETARASGADDFELDARALFIGGGGGAYLEQIAEIISARMRAGKHVVLHTPNQPEMVRETRELGASLGLSPTETGRHLSAALAEVAARVRSLTGQDRMILAGGETSDAVCKRLGVDVLRVWEEIEPGLPSCLTLTEPPMLLVLKSGSFGTPRFFLNALDHIRSA